MLGTTKPQPRPVWRSSEACPKPRRQGVVGLRFLKILFWLAVVVLMTLFAARNWRDVTIDLWGNLQADVKIPVLVLITFLIGFIPTWMVYRTKLWRARNRVSLPQREARVRPPADQDSELAQ